MFAKKKLVQLLAGLLVVTCLSVFVVPKIYYAIVDRDKNNYLLTTTDLDPKKVDMTGIMLTIKVDNPQKETILLTSSELGVLGGDNISTFYKARHPELAGRVEIVDEGIKLRLKASDKPVTLKLPIEIPYSIKTTFDIRRGKRSISKNKVSFTEKKPGILEESPAILKEETPELPPPSGQGQVAPARRQKVSTSPSLNSLSFKNPLTKPSPRLLGSPTSDTGWEGYDIFYSTINETVSNEAELLGLLDGLVMTEEYRHKNVIINLRADIWLNRSMYYGRGGIMNLPGFETTYIINGNGRTLHIGPKVRNKPVFKIITPSKRPPKAITLTNLRIDYGDTAPGNESVLVYIPANESNNFGVILQDIRGMGRKQGRLVYAPHATTILSGDIQWCSDASEVSNDNKLGMVYSREISVRKLGLKRSPTIDLRSTWDTFKSTQGVYASDNGQDAIVAVRACRVSLTTTKGSAIYMNRPSSRVAAKFEVEGGAQLTCRTKKGAAAITIYSENWRKTSQSIISGGAKVVAINDNGGTAFFHRVKEFGTLRVTGSGTKLTVKAGEDNSGTSGALHFSLVGHQKLRVEDKAEVVVTKEKGRSAAIRFANSGNDILISGGGVLTVRNLGWTGGSPEEQKRNKLSDGGDANGGQGIQFTDGPENETWIRVKGEGSRIDVRSEIGPALETRANTELTLSKYTRGSFIGRTASSEVGAVVFSLGKGKITLTKAAFRFRNNHESTRGTGKTKKIVGGKWISGAADDRWNIPLKVEDTTLQVWNRNPKVSLDGEPSKRWGVMYFTLEKKDWNTITSSTNPNFRREYGKSTDYAQFTGEGFKAEVEKIRQPTNADKRIYGHVEIPAAFPVSGGGKQMRDADTDEVWVTLKLYRLKLKPGGVKYNKNNNSGIDVGATYDVVTYEKEVPTIGRKGTTTGENKDLDGVRQFGEPKTYGIFEWDLSKDQAIKRDKGDPFLWAGEYVEVIRIRRGGKKPDEKIDIISTNAMCNQGKYVFNVRPVEVSSYALVDPVLGKLPAKPQVSDATKEIELGITTKNMRRHMALVPLDVIEKGKDDQQKEKLKDIVTGWSYAAYNSGGKFGYLPMLTTGQETTVDPVGSENGKSKIAAVELSGSDKQDAFLRPRTYLTADQATANRPSELFVMSGWGDDISSLGKDLPPTYQKVSSLTTRDADELSHQVTAFWASINDKRELTGLKMPAKKTTYHDAEFGASPKLNLTPVVPKELAIDLTRKGRGAIDQVDITGSQLVTYQLKLRNPNPLATPTEMLMGYQVTFTVTGLAEIVDTLDLILPDGVSETHTAKSITFTSKGRRSLGETVRIPLAVVGDFDIEVKGTGRTPQEKTYAMPRGIWNIDGEQHNALGDPFWLHQPLPPADDLFFRDYYHLLKAPDQKVSVKVTRDNVKHPVYLSIRDNQLTVYYRQLKSGSQVTVTVDGKKLTTFKAEGGTTEQAKPLDLKVNGLRSIVKVSYTTDKEQAGSVTWKNPKLAAE